MRWVTQPKICGWEGAARFETKQPDSEDLSEDPWTVKNAYEDMSYAISHFTHYE